MTKENIFSLINMKNYNNALEKILEKKDFTEDVKNLLLSMLYKIENAYEDYETIKKDVQTKNQYIKSLLNVINNCNEITLVKQMSEEDKMLKKEGKVCKVDQDAGKIIVYQNEEMMLRALQEMAPKQIIIKEKYELYEKVLRELFSKGYIYNNVEIIRDFNGWSWNINKKSIEDLEYNLIYQNILMILGMELVNCIINNCKEDEEELPNNEILRSKYLQMSEIEDKQVDYIKIIKEKLEEKYGEKLKNEIVESFKKVILIIISNRDKNEKEKIKKIKEENEKFLEQMEDKQKFITQITNRKKEISKQIKKIDNAMNDIELLKKGYEEINKKLSNKEKIFSASQYANNLIIKRREYLEEMNNINKIMEPKEFIKLKEEKESKKKFFDIWNIENNKKIDEQPYLIDLQIQFLKALKQDIQNTENKNEILEYIYKLRYYKFIPYKNKKISDVKELKSHIEEVEKILINKACDKKVITRLSEDNELNYNILKNLFTTKIIKLESMVIILKYNKDILSVEMYDANIMENIEKIKIGKKTELSVKLKKKIKIFI